MDLTAVVIVMANFLGACTQLLISFWTLLRVWQLRGQMQRTEKAVNGRIDMLLEERERRLRAEHAAELERVRAQSLSGILPQARPEVIVKTIPPGSQEAR